MGGEVDADVRVRELEIRVGRMQREMQSMRRWLVIVALVFAMALLSVPLGIGPLAGMFSDRFVETYSTQALVSTNKLVLYGAGSEKGAELTMVGDSPMLRLTDGRGVVVLGVAEDGPYLGLGGGQAGTISLDVHPTAGPWVRLLDGEDEPIWSVP